MVDSSGCWGQFIEDSSGCLGQFMVGSSGFLRRPHRSNYTNGTIFRL